MKRVLKAVVFLGALAVASPLAAQTPAQGAAGGGQANNAPPTNLQVLPKDTSRADVVTLMRGYAGALGVQCNYCHVQEGRGGRNDMAADEKPTKNTARVMMRMVNNVNMQLSSAISKPDLTKVDCGTCHRGSAIPTKYEPPAPAAGQGGAPAGRGQ
jgi:hypothetical protein